MTVFGAQSDHIPDDPDINAQFLGKRWGAHDTMPDWEVKGLTARDWGAPRMWIQAGPHDPEIVLARFDYAYDRVTPAFSIAASLASITALAAWRSTAAWADGPPKRAVDRAREVVHR